MITSVCITIVCYRRTLLYVTVTDEKSSEILLYVAAVVFIRETHPVLSSPYGISQNTNSTIHTRTNAAMLQIAQQCLA